MSCYSDFPVPAEYPNFMHNRLVLQYLRSYAEHFELFPYIRFHTEVNPAPCSVVSVEKFAFVCLCQEGSIVEMAVYIEKLSSCTIVLGCELSSIL